MSSNPVFCNNGLCDNVMAQLMLGNVPSITVSAVAFNYIAWFIALGQGANPRGIHLGFITGFRSPHASYPPTFSHYMLVKRGNMEKLNPSFSISLVLCSLEKHNPGHLAMCTLPMLITAGQYIHVIYAGHHERSSPRGINLSLGLSSQPTMVFSVWLHNSQSPALHCNSTQLSFIDEFLLCGVF
jgi:hypothetical protein